MVDLAERLAEVEAEAAQLRREIAQGPCRKHGHDWKHIGGCNAGCCDHCGCSVPVHECTKCKDCDYGDNEEANEVRKRCAELCDGEATRP